MERKHPLAACEKCPYQEGTAYVPSQFPKKPARLTVLGEAPGPQEASVGIPFQGPSGMLLDTVLEHHGIRRDECFVSNVCSCRPYGPTEKPPKEAVEACRERLEYEVDQADTEYILAVGNTAAKVCLDDNRTITHLRVGPPKPYKRSDETKVVATWHPAYCLRTPDEFPSFVDDVGKLFKPYLMNWESPSYRVFDNPENAATALRRLAENTTDAVIDIEVGVEKDFDYTHPEEYDLLCVGIAYAPKKAVVIGENALKDEVVVKELDRYLDKVRIIGHNLRFDLRGLTPLIGVKKQYFDTLLASYAVDERPRHHGLKTLAVERLGAPKYDDEIKQYIPRGGSYANIPRPILYKYNAYDVACTWELYELFTEELGEQRKIHDFMIKISNELIYLELAGIHIDLEYNAKLQKEFTSIMNDLEDQINEVAGYTINPRSVPQVKNYLIEIGKLIVKTTKAEFLEEIRPKLDGTQTGKFVELLLKYRKVSKLYSTYVKKLPQKLHQGKIHTSYLLHGSTSGRLASRNDNLMNISRDKRIKNQYVVEHEDNLLIQADYKQNEGRTICALAKDEYLRELFNDPKRDIFDEMCNDIFGKGNWDSEDRVKIKSVFYGSAYGRGISSIAQELEIEWEEANSIIRQFKELTPNMTAWQASVTKRVLDGEDLVTPFGRRRSFHLITKENKHEVINEALSYLPQSIASDICLSSLVTLRRLLDGMAVIRLTVHDSLVAECHKDNVDRVTSLMKREMLDAGRKFTTYVNYAVDISTGKRYGEL